MDGIRIDTTGEVELELSKQESEYMLAALLCVRQGPLVTESRKVYSHLIHALTRLGVEL